ncbi:RNA polymerase sigma factor [Dactylosporangium sucinum]|uniref:RNA polymerase sigma factor n=1 Tax=Dactylosporangium sucinum TaxID=1424081 RepID=UPI00167D8DDE|nr:RNA polymerase sigma factor [Dactylosporangium sucinum]
MDLDTAVEIIYRRALRLSEGKAQLAQDLTQDVLAKIVHDLRSGTLAPVVEPRPWLRALVNNQFIQHYRAERRLKRGGAQWTESLDRHREQGLDPPSTVPGPEETVADRDLRARLRTAVAALPSPIREVVELVLDGHTHREIAEILGIPENTSKTRLRTAVRHLRDTLCSASE